MSEQPESGGVFGNLPRSRPGTRSPLREPDKAAAQQPPAEDAMQGGDPAPKATHAQAAPEPDAPADREQTGAGERPAAGEQEGGGLEDLAWAGIAAAAEAATIGVRLASRAMEAVKDAGKRA